MNMKIDYQLAEQWIAPSSKVLDLGCGDGELLHHLQTKLKISGYGIELDSDKMNEAIAKGVNIIEQDLNDGLANFADDSFDTVVMARALQAVQYPDKLLLDMLRVGRQVIVTFPNFAHWQNRIHLGLRGMMPVSKALPYEWYNTPNIHLSTFKDFECLCQENGIKIIDQVAVSEDVLSQNIRNLGNIAEKGWSKQAKQSKQKNKPFGMSKPLSIITKKIDKVIDVAVKKSPNLLADVAVYRVVKE